MVKKTCRAFLAVVGVDRESSLDNIMQSDDDDDHDASLLVSPIGSSVVVARDNGDELQNNNAPFAVGPERSHFITNRRTSNHDVIFHNDDNDSMSSSPSLVQTPVKSKFNYLEAMAELEYLAPTPATTTAAATTEKKEGECSIRMKGTGGEALLAMDGDVEFDDENKANNNNNNKKSLVMEHDDNHNHTGQQLTSNSTGVDTTNNSSLMGRRVLFALSSSSSPPMSKAEEDSSTTCMMEMTNVNNNCTTAHEVEAVEQYNSNHNRVNDFEYYSASLQTAKDYIGRKNDVSSINVTNNNNHDNVNDNDVSFVFRRPDFNEESYSGNDSFSSSIELKLGGHDMNDSHDTNIRQLVVGDERKMIMNTDFSSIDVWDQSLDCRLVGHTNGDPSDDDVISTNDKKDTDVNGVNVNIESTNNKNQATNKVIHRRPTFRPPLTSVDDDIDVPSHWDLMDTTDSEETIDAERSSGNKLKSTYVERMNESIDNYFSNRLDLLPEGNNDDDGGGSRSSSSSINEDRPIPENINLSSIENHLGDISCERHETCNTTNGTNNDEYNEGTILSVLNDNSSQIDVNESLESAAYVISNSNYQHHHEDIIIDSTNASHVVVKSSINESNPTVDLICSSTSNDDQVSSDSKNQLIDIPIDTQEDSMPSNDATHLSNSNDVRDVKAAIDPVVSSEHSKISVDDDKYATLSLSDPNAAFRQELKSSLGMRPPISCMDGPDFLRSTYKPLVAETFEERRGIDPGPLAVMKQTLPDNSLSPNHSVDISSGDLLAIDDTGSEPEPSIEGRGKSSIFHVLSHQTDQDLYASETIQTSSIEGIATVDDVVMDQPGHYYNNKSLASEDVLGDFNVALECCKPSPPEIATQGNRSSLDDLSSYQESFNSTSNEFMERLRHAAESRKREVTRSRYSMERKELALYEEKTERGDAVLSAVDEEVMTELPIQARASPTSSNGRTRSGSVSSIAIGAKRKTSNAFRPHPSQNDSSHVKKLALNAKPQKRMLSGEDASIAEEISHRKLVQKEEERNKHKSTFVARPLPMTTHVRSHPLPPLVGENLLSVAATSVVNNTNSNAFIPHSSIRAEKRKSYDAARTQRDQQRREADIETRRQRIEQTKREIQDLTKQIR